jgi:hypothetical protein
MGSEDSDEQTEARVIRPGLNCLLNAANSARDRKICASIQNDPVWTPGDRWRFPVDVSRRVLESASFFHDASVPLVLTESRLSRREVERGLRDFESETVGSEDEHVMPTCCAESEHRTFFRRITNALDLHRIVSAETALSPEHCSLLTGEQAQTAQSDCRRDLQFEPASHPGRLPFHF